MVINLHPYNAGRVRPTKDDVEVGTDWAKAEAISNRITGAIYQIIIT